MIRGVAQDVPEDHFESECFNVFSPRDTMAEVTQGLLGERGRGERGRGERGRDSKDRLYIYENFCYNEKTTPQNTTHY